MAATKNKNYKRGMVLVTALLCTSPDSQVNVTQIKFMLHSNKNLYLGKSSIVDHSSHYSQAISAKLRYCYLNDLNPFKTLEITATKHAIDSNDSLSQRSHHCWHNIY